MRERTAEILEAAVQGFIDLGEPVSSSWLYRHYDFGIKPAMIRLELEDLVERGFLEQPHHSAGRVPKDKGYKFFAERILGHADPDGSQDKRLQNLFERRNWDELLDRLSSELGLLGAVNDSQEGIMHKSGLENLIDNLEWETPEEIKGVIHDFMELESRLDSAEQKLIKGDLQVFIGRKSPVTRSENLTVITGGYNLGHENVLLLAIGPKRMDYKKTLHIFKNFYE